MTRKLEELFGLTDEETNIDTPIVVTEMSEQDIETHKTALTNLEKIENALIEVRDLDTADKELDDIAKMAKESADTLLDLGMQVDSRFSAEIFNSASSMLGHAITAKTAKINKKLRMIDLQLKKAELDRKIAVANNKQQSAEVPTEGTGKVVDRNDLIKSFLAEAAKKTQKDK